ncbi:MAG TPA: ComF family protein [Pseudonocardiaceae bacterium]|jgi:predicted amidophosphoribosyltransferase|nr:ComF family protein [Pseudonocardiaceae bacterium]
MPTTTPTSVAARLLAHPLAAGALLADLVLPLRCAGCDAPGSGLCALCRQALDPGADGPVAVHRPSASTGPPIYALTDYLGRARSVLLAFKERDRRDLAAPLGELLAAALLRIPSVHPAADGTWWLVPAPSRARAARRRGGSHLLRLARATATALSATGHPVCVAPALRLAAGVRDSVGLDRRGRTENLAGRVLLHPAAAPPPGTSVILLDDIVTTGATATACAQRLRAGGVPVGAVLTIAAV